jgi:hypothetical protein
MLLFGNPPFLGETMYLLMNNIIHLNYEFPSGGWVCKKCCVLEKKPCTCLLSRPSSVEIMKMLFGKIFVIDWQKRLSMEEVIVELSRIVEF